MLLYTNKPKSAKTNQDAKIEKRPRKLLDQVRDAIRRKHYSIRTEEARVSRPR